MLDNIDPEILSNATGVLATLSPGGKPQLTAVWFIVRNGHVLISINGKRQKTKNLQSNPDCSFLICHPNTQDYFVEIRGTAAVVPDNDYVQATEIGVKYQADFRNFDQPGDERFIVDITPTKVLTTDVRH